MAGRLLQANPVSGLDRAFVKSSDPAQQGLWRSNDPTLATYRYQAGAAGYLEVVTSSTAELQTRRPVRKLTTLRRRAAVQLVVPWELAGRSINWGRCLMPKASVAAQVQRHANAARGRLAAFGGQCRLTCENSGRSSD